MTVRQTSGNVQYEGCVYLEFLGGRHRFQRHEIMFTEVLADTFSEKVMKAMKRSAFWEVTLMEQVEKKYV